jgi:hypothetical protein
VRTADNLTTFMCRVSRNLGASNSWNPKGLSRPVMGLLYLLIHSSNNSLGSNQKIHAGETEPHCVTVQVVNCGLMPKDIRLMQGRSYGKGIDILAARTESV